MHDAVRDGTGLLVPVRDPEALTAAIRAYWTIRPGRQHGANGRGRAVRDFDRRTYASLFQEYLRLAWRPAGAEE